MTKKTIKQQILSKISEGRKLIAFLIDPDSYQGEKLTQAIQAINKTLPDIVLVGGSLVSTSINSTIIQLKKETNLPIILYPGSLLQLSTEADAILLISLISGRNPELLIGNHVLAAPIIRQSKIETLSTGYILIDGNSRTSVEYISQTTPIPANKPDITVATAIAGEMLGMQFIYLEAGSGASNPVAPSTIKQVKEKLNIPLIVGGGINSSEKIKAACHAGADIIVIGNALEKDLSQLEEFSSIVRNF